MNLLPGLFHFYIPSFLKKKGLKELFISTAAAFNKRIPSLKGLSFENSLLKYALFTKEEVEKYIVDGGDPLNLHKGLNEHAILFGKKLRKIFFIKSFKKAVSIFELLYSFIGIDLKISGEGEISVKKCFFSNYYTPNVCAIISAIDSGVFEGISGGCRIEFRQRITEGNDCCKARIILKDRVL